MNPMAVLLIIVVLAAVAFAGVSLLEYFSSSRRAVRSDRKADTKELRAKTQQLYVAKKALMKIAANDTGNPSLDANIALEDISNIELKELES